MSDYRQIVGDEDVGEAELALEVLQQIDDLCLNGDIERRHWLVQDQQSRLQRQCPRDADPLALTTRELTRISSNEAARETDQIKQIADPPVPAHLFEHAVNVQWLGDDVADRQDRV